MRPDPQAAALSFLTLALTLVGPCARLPPAAAPDHGRDVVSERAGQAVQLREGGRLDINRADAEGLRLLPGIGPSLSARILAERRAHGPFGSVEALTRVRGIGPASVARLRPLIRAGPPPHRSADVRVPKAGSPSRQR